MIRDQGAPASRRVAVHLTKVAPEYFDPLFRRYLGPGCELYQRGGDYDAVLFWNLHPEIQFVRRHTDIRVAAIAVEPKGMWPANYDPELHDLCDLYVGYRDIGGPDSRGKFKQWVYPAGTREEIATFAGNIQSRRPYTFGIFARHDPNIRQEIGTQIAPHGGLLAGPLFGRPVEDKRALQRQIRFEFITENEINDYYMSEKLPQALLAGCVPVYHGCTLAADRIPSGLFVDMHAFPSVRAVVEYCLTPGVYEAYLQRIRREARQVLEAGFAWETNVFSPLDDFLTALERRGCGTGGRRSLRWRAETVRTALRATFRATRVAGR